MSKYNVAHHEILYLSLLFCVELKKWHINVSVKYHDCVNDNCEFILMKDANHTAVL